MSRLTLKHIIRKKNEAENMLHTLIKQLHSKLWIEDESGKILMGEPFPNPVNELPVMLNDEIAGWVKGDDKAVQIAGLLTYMINKEAEKKKLGSEVLHLYQEVNLIFDFSEKMAKAIGADNISKTTLEVASQVIKADHGVIVLWDEKKRRLEVMATLGALFFDEEKINEEIVFLSSMILNGQSEIISDTASLIAAGIVLPEVQSVIYSSLKVNNRIMGAVILAGKEGVQYHAVDLKLITTLALQASAAIESSILYEKSIAEAKEREAAMRKVYDITEKFVPFEFIRSLGHEVITDVKLGDQVEKIVTVLFSDIRAYTTLSEKMSPEENFKFVCSFNERIGPFIRKHNGFINQYLGDAIMAIFPGNASDALMAAIEIQKELQQFNARRKEENLQPIEIGVGMHTGPLIMGITGDNERLDACTISDTVNIASRLEGLTKHYRAGIILSHASYLDLPENANLLLRQLGLVQLKGKMQSIKIHECFNAHEPGHIENKTATRQLFEQGIQDYEQQQVEKAHQSFKKIIAADPADTTAQFFFNHTRQNLLQQTVSLKPGIIEMHEK